MNIGFALEYSLGHTTHAMNLKRTLADDTSVHPIFVDLPYQGMAGWWTKLPGVKSNWSTRASLGAYLGLRRRAKSLDSALFHTQVTALFSSRLMRTMPSVVSLDATPIQYDTLGAAYGHRPSDNVQLEELKKRLNMRSFASARQLVTWSDWAKQSLISDYGVAASKVQVIPPGIDVSRWQRSALDVFNEGVVNLLFVGADFFRKGGETLLAACRSLCECGKAHLHVVTKTEGVGDGIHNVTVYRNIGPNSEVLIRLFQQADIFVFPTIADCLPLAILEAMSAGLPVIATDVAAIPEAVVDGENGIIVPPADAGALSDAIGCLVSAPNLRRTMGKNARERACARFDSAKNYSQLVEVVKSVA